MHLLPANTKFYHSMITSLAFHPAGTIIASASTDKSIKLFDVRTHKLIQHYGDAHGSGPSGLSGELAQGGVTSIAFGGANGEWLLSTGMDGVVKIWDLKEGHLFYTLHGHKHGATTATAFSPTGDYFATGAADAQVMVWKSNFDSLLRGIEQQQAAGLDAAAAVASGRAHAAGAHFAHHPDLVGEVVAPTGSARNRTKNMSIVGAEGVASASGGLSHQPKPLHNGDQQRVAPKIVSVGSPLFAEQVSVVYCLCMCTCAMLHCLW
jgi:centriolar protein POC1